MTHFANAISDLPLGPLAFGCASIGNLNQAISDAQARDVLDSAWDHGLRYFDTAPHYGRGLSEQRLSVFLEDHPDALVSTKVGRVLSPAAQPIAEADGFVKPAQNDIHYDYSGDGIEESLEQSFARLGRSRVEIAFVHDIGRLTHGGDNDRHCRDLLETGFDRLRRLQAQGKIGAVGIGVNECEICLELLAEIDLDVILLAGRYTLLDRSAEERLLQVCAARGVALVIGGVFNSGILATGAIEGALWNYGPAPDAIKEKVCNLEQICASHNVPLPAAALQFPLRHPIVASVLIGTGQSNKLKRNLDQVAVEIPQAFWDDIEV